MNDNPTETLIRRSTRGDRRAGVSLVELLVTLGLFLLLLMLVMGISDDVRLGFRRGTVNLQNLQEARLALASLRRDFLAAVPVLSLQDPAPVRQRIRRRPLLAIAQGQAANHSSEPILVAPQELSFRMVTGFDAAANPVLEPVRYTYDAGRQELQRVTPNRTMTFKGVRSLCFSLVAHAAADQIPRVWVAMEVQREQAPGQPAPVLSVGTLLTSRTAADLARFPAWNLLTF